MTASRSAAFTVEQGPRWLAELIFDPPLWFTILLIGLACLAAAGVLGALNHHGWSVDEATKLDMLTNVTIVFAVGGGVYLLRLYGSFPYAVDVGGGLVVGLVVAKGLRRYCYRPALTHRNP